MGIYSGTDFISGYTGDQTDAALAAARSVAGVNGIVACNGSGLFYSKGVDYTPVANSSNLITSGGVKAALNAKQNTLTFDNTPTAGSTNPVTSGGIKTALDAKQNTLTFDNSPTTGSANPVTSGGVKNYVDGEMATKQDDLQLSIVDGMICVTYEV